MNTLLVIAPKSDLAAEVRAALDPADFRVIPQAELSEDELRLYAPAIDACVCDADSNSAKLIALLNRLRRILPGCPVILYTTDSRPELEEQAYLAGASHILTKPVRGTVLAAILKRPDPEGAEAKRPPARARSRRPAGHAAPPAEAPSLRMELLRNYSSILLHNLNVKTLLKEFLPSLRKIIGVNRAAIFLRPAPGSLGGATEAEGSRVLRAAAWTGLPTRVLENFELSLDSGIGGHLFKTGRILQRDSEDGEADAEVSKEFELMGAQVAVPVMDRESMVGLAVFDARVTGEPLVGEELVLVFQLLEQLGQSIKNIWLNDEIGAEREMMSDVLGEFSSGCIVIARDLTILHANEMARKCFVRGKAAPRALEFADLPQSVSSRVMEILNTGVASASFRYQPTGFPEEHFHISASPFRKRGTATPNAVLLIIEDCGQDDRLRQLELETANLRFVQEMADRLSHEIGNAVVPLSTHQQLFKERHADPDFQESLAGALEEGVRRVSRLVSQMRYLARDRIEFMEAVSVKKMIEEAFREARGYHPASPARLLYESSEALTVACDRTGLQHAFAEIILNALQANGKPGQVRVRSRAETAEDGTSWVRIEVEDGGGGFTPEAANKAARPFFTTRNVGLGLGLAVTNKIIQTHSGKLEIPPPRAGQHGLVRVSLPMKPPAGPADN